MLLNGDKWVADRVSMRWLLVLDWIYGRGRGVEGKEWDIRWFIGLFVYCFLFSGVYFGVLGWVDREGIFGVFWC
jgi:hypothetical protein